jgi:hypothetical protein
MKNFFLFKRISILFSFLIVFVLLILDFFFLLKSENYGELYDTLIKPFNFFISKKIQEGTYPFFFNSFNGMDIIGESQSAPLYPLNLILSFLNIDIDTKYNILITSYLIIGLIGIFFFIKKKINLDSILLLILFLLIPFFRVNFVHQFFIGSIVYFLVTIFIYMLKIDNKISDKHFIIFSSISISLLILVGNYTLQWLFLTALIISLFVTCKKFNKSFLLFISPIIFAGFISFIQIILTLDLMQTSDRAIGFFDYSKFNNFLSGFVISNFFNGFSAFSISEFFHKGITGFNTDNLVFIGLLPMICIFSDIKHNNIFKSPVRFFLFLIFVIAFFRGLGGLFLPNFILKSLPIFGQMRSVFRDLITVQVIFLAYFFYLFRENKIILDKKVTTGLVIISFLIFASNEIVRLVETKEFFYLNFIYLIFPTCYLLIILLKKKNLFTTLLFVCIFELSFCNSFYPSLLGKKKLFDEVKNCNIPLELLPEYYKFKYKYDHTIYKNILGNHPLESKKNSDVLDDSATSCPSIHYIDQSTLTSLNTKLFFEHEKESSKFLRLYLSLLFPNISKVNTVEMNDFISMHKNLFVEINFNSTEIKMLIFKWMKKFNIDHYFQVENNYKPSPVLLSNKIMNAVPYGDKRILIFDNNKEIVKTNIIGPFNLIDYKYKKINIYYIPIFELLGSIISFFSIFLFCVYIKCKK